MKTIQIVKQQVTAMEELAYCKSRLSVEFMSLEPATNVLKSLVPGIISAFKGSETVVVLPEIIKLNKDQKKFLKVLEAIPYSEVGELKAYVPEGMNCTYLEYLALLLPVTEYFKGLQSNVVQPYCLFLAQLVSDVKSSTTTDSQAQVYRKIQSHREYTYSAFSKLYDKDSYVAETKVKSVVQRNADWTSILNRVNEATANIQAVDIDMLKKQVISATEYLELIYQDLQKGTDKQTSKEAASRLAEGAYQVASELEFFATTYYRVLALNGQIANTIENINRVYG
jgi:hypothetical protein